MLRKSGGCVRKFHCPFHGLTPSLDGQLDHVPEGSDFDHLKWAEFSLPEAKVDVWAGFAFINMDHECEELERCLEILPEHFVQSDQENRYKAIYVAKVMPCNWKLCTVAFVEAYHVSYTHPGVVYRRDTVSVPMATTQSDRSWRSTSSSPRPRTARIQLISNFTLAVSMPTRTKGANSNWRASRPLHNKRQLLYQE